MASGSIQRKMRQQISSFYPARMQYHKFSTKPCKFKGHVCPKPCVDGYVYCIRHILEDENAPFQQCSFSYSHTMKKCPNAAPKCDVESYCPDHLNKMQRTKNRAGKSQPQISSERLFSSLKHLVNYPTNKNVHIDDNVKKIVNPFTDIDALSVNAMQSSVLDYCSESDSDVDTSIIARTTRCKEEESSDAESNDSAEEDPLKFAAVYTAEEALLLARTKSERLKKLYVEQLNHLNHDFRERRRDYLTSIQKEKETLCSVAEQSKVSIKDMKLAEKIKCYNHYRKFYGVEAILRKKMKDKRKGLIHEYQIGRPGGYKCIFTEGGVKCNVRTLPNAKFCPKHILNDPSQVLFRPCGFVDDENTCKEPLPAMEPCIYHMDMVPAQIVYNTTLSSEDDEDHSMVKEEEIDSKNTTNDIGSSPIMINSSGLEPGEVKLNSDDRIENMELLDTESFVFSEEIVVCDEDIVH